LHRSELNDTDEYKTSAIHGKINLDMKTIKKKHNYVAMPVYYSFGIKKVRTVKKY
jgi:hypothetical protein